MPPAERSALDSLHLCTSSPCSFDFFYRIPPVSRKSLPLSWVHSLQDTSAPLYMRTTFVFLVVCMYRSSYYVLPSSAHPHANIFFLFLFSFSPPDSGVYMLALWNMITGVEYLRMEKTNIPALIELLAHDREKVKPGTVQSCTVPCCTVQFFIVPYCILQYRAKRYLLVSRRLVLYRATVLRSMLIVS